MIRPKPYVDDLLPPGHRADMGASSKGSRREMPCARQSDAASIAAMNAVDLASLLCSRLCHDLMSPVGALNNGIELMADESDPEMREKCLELLGESARASANKLKFFRLAFGAAGGFGDSIDTHEAEAALEGVFGPERSEERRVGQEGV